MLYPNIGIIRWKIIEYEYKYRRLLQYNCKQYVMINFNDN